MLGTVGAAILMYMQAIAPQPESASAGRWQVDVAPAQCRLTRSIGGSQPSAISIQTVPGSEAYQLTLASPQLQSFPKASPTSASLRFGDVRVIEGRAQAGVIDGELGAAVRMSGLPPEMLDALAAASGLALEYKSKVAGTFALPGSAKAVAALRRCNAEQLIEWGADAAQFEPGGVLPVALVPHDNWVPDNDLLRIRPPRDDFMALFRVSIGVDGKIEACEAIDAGGSDSVTGIACTAVLGKRLLKPAQAASGRTVRGVATFEIRLFRRPNR